MKNSNPNLKNIENERAVDFDPEFEEDANKLPDGMNVEDELRDNGSSRMIEADSYDVMISGLKQAAEACRNVSLLLRLEKFDKAADLLDQMRKQAALRYGRAIGPDIRATPKATPEAAIGMGRMAAYLRIKEGLDHAHHGARQIGACQRQDEWWIEMGWGLHDLSAKVWSMIQMRAGSLDLVV